MGGEKIRRIELGEETVGEARESTEHIKLSTNERVSFNKKTCLLFSYIRLFIE